MIHLRPDCLVFKMSTGENIPCSAEKVTIELLGTSAEFVDQQLIKNAAEAVLHYFKTELQRTSVSVAEFSLALEHVLRGLGLHVMSADPTIMTALPPAVAASSARRVVNTDLTTLVGESGIGFELTFFPRLRDELRAKLGQSPDVLRFSGLRPCVKSLVGTKRWTGECQALSDQIVEYLRGCLHDERHESSCALVVG